MQRINANSATYRAIVDYLNANNALYTNQFEVNDSYDLAAIDNKISSLTDKERNNLLFDAYEESQALRDSCVELSQFTAMLADIIEAYV